MDKERHDFNNLEELETNGIFPISEADKEAVLNYIYKSVPVFYDEDFRVYTESGIYIADLYNVNEEPEVEQEPSVWVSTPENEYRDLLNQGYTQTAEEEREQLLRNSRIEDYIF